jgi:hypothetical protein
MRRFRSDSLGFDVSDKILYIAIGLAIEVGVCLCSKGAVVTFQRQRLGLELERYRNDWWITGQFQIAAQNCSKDFYELMILLLQCCLE